MHHLFAVFVAHAKAYTAPQMGNYMIDGISSGCLNCHDGQVGPFARYCLPSQGEQCTNHPIGVEYSLASATNLGLRSLESVSPLISLYEGRVGCASCHSHYSLEKKLLTVEKMQGILSQQCHPK